MKNVFAGNSDVWFKCGCESGGKPVEWRITSKDEKGVTEQPLGTVIDHECKGIIAYRRHKGIKRFYLNKKSVAEKRRDLIAALLGILKFKIN